jgi:cyanophycinase
MSRRLTMRRNVGVAACAALVAVLASRPVAQLRPEPPEVGPAHGALVIIGGGEHIGALLKRFIDLAGGPEASLALIPTAAEGDDPAYYWEDLRDLEQAGARHIKVLNTRDRTVADSEAFASQLRDVSGVFFIGGRQWRLADAYLHTRTQTELEAVLDRGGVLAGTSAGATILGSFMVRGDTKSNETMVGDHVESMGFLKNAAIDQHLLKRNRQFDLIPVIEAHPELLGIGIDEDTAVVVRRDRFDVVGAGYVAVYDHARTLDSGGAFYLLTQGDSYNLKTREAQRPQLRGAPIERVVKKPWPRR